MSDTPSSEKQVQKAAEKFHLTGPLTWEKVPKAPTPTFRADLSTDQCLLLEGHVVSRQILQDGQYQTISKDTLRI